MKNIRHLLLGIATGMLCAFTLPLAAQTAGSPASQPLRIGVLNTKRCLEESKWSKQEQANLEKMKGQMQSTLKEKEKAVVAIDNKLRDEDYLDSITDEAERELKHKRKILIEEGMELNRQFADTLEMTNMKMIQSMIDLIQKASKEVAQEMAKGNQPIDLILTSEACTYFAPTLELTDKVIARLNAIFDAEQKNPSLGNAANSAMNSAKAATAK